MKGLVHIYCGDGKGKTTASVGLAVRAAGTGKQVLFTQFFKDGSSGEVAVLKQIPGIKTMHCEKKHGFFFRMDEQQKAAARQDYTELFRRALSEAEQADLLILDEVISSCNHGTVPEQELLDFLDRKPEKLEVVLTGRDPSEALQERANYITEMCKRRHPFDQGIGARKGIEY